MRTLAFCFVLLCGQVHADTMNHYMNIVNSIPKMEMKADPQAQAWARSARNVLTITAESIAETLLEANASASTQGKPFFCLPVNQQLSAATLNSLIQQTYRANDSQLTDKDNMTVSQMAWTAVKKTYPCSSKTTHPDNQMQHMSAAQ